MSIKNKKIKKIKKIKIKIKKKRSFRLVKWDSHDP